MTTTLDLTRPALVLVEHVQAVLGGARELDLPVIHDHVVAFPGRDFGGSNAPVFQMIGPDGYRAVLATDATSSINEEWPDAATSLALTNIPQLVTTADVVAAEPTVTAG